MRRQGGFTMVELIMVMVMVGVLAAIGIPKLMGGNTTGALVFGDQVASALRHAQTSAVSHRRVVCLATTARTLVMRIRTAPAAATAPCTTAFGPLLQRADNDTYDSSDATVTTTGAPANLYFQPDGTITGTPAGAPLGQVTIAIELAGKTQRRIVFEGSTGYVE
ncbi:MSHA pilin protein MshC [Massilia sp. MP_M2]|uniref:pilus assembly FimT family protein n=1 Tax=Massilia sp. MP_M2 TaxID=3071713 RepID=UPI00319E8F6D